MLRILQVSDSHLSARNPEAVCNWEAVLAHVERDPPDLVVNTGDVSLDGADSVDDLEFARSQHERLAVPWRVIPGNHDIGDVGTERQRLDDARRARFSGVFGESFWSLDRGSWRLVGVDIQTLMSDLPDTESRWEWLAGELATMSQVALFVHRPLMPLSPGEIDNPIRYVLPRARQRLTDLIDTSNVGIVASGHVHQARLFEVGGCRHVWAPSTWAVLPDDVQPTIGTKLVGVVEHRLDADADPATNVIIPEGIGQLMIGREVTSPYEH